MKKKIVSMALAIVLALSLCACANKEAGNTAAAADTSTAAGSSAAAEENTSKELTKLSLGTSPWPTNMFFYLAKEKGIFEKNGLDVTIQEFASTTESSNAFVGGQIDFCTYASSETIAPFAQGAEFSVVLETDKSNGL